MDLNSCSVWQKSPRKVVTFLKTFTVFICIIRNLCFVFVVWIYWSLWTFCLAVSLGWGKSQNVVSFPWLEEYGLFMLGFKIDFSVCACTALCSGIFLEDQPGQKQLRKVSGEQSSHLNTYMKEQPLKKKLRVPNNSHLEQWELLSAHSFRKIWPHVASKGD